MNDTGWRRNKYGGLFNVNDYMNKKIRERKEKPQTFDLFHGTAEQFNEFDDQYIGKNSRGGLTYGKGHYFMDEQSDIYGKEGYKVQITSKKPFIVQHNKWSAELERMGYDWFDSSRLDPSDFLASKGYDATIIKNGDRIAEAIVYTNKDKKIKITKRVKNY